jgi:hypothetical protein
MSIVTPERPVDAPGAPTPSGPNRNWWHVFNSVVALGAVTIGVIALTRDPATKTVEVPATPAATPADMGALGRAWLGDPGPALGIPSDNPTDLQVTTGGVAPSVYADPGPVLGIPSDNPIDLPAAGGVPMWQNMPAGWPATDVMRREAEASLGGVPSDKYADLVPAAPAAGGVPSDKYADRVPAYQYDIAKQHAPVSPTGPRPAYLSPR